MIRIEQATTEHIDQMADLLAVLFSEEQEFGPTGKSRSAPCG